MSENESIEERFKREYPYGITFCGCAADGNGPLYKYPSHKPRTKEEEELEAENFD